MKEVFKERIDNRIETYILLCSFTFLFLLSDYPWASIVVGLVIYFWFGPKHYYFIFTDSRVEVVYPLMPKKNITIELDEIEAIYHLILYKWKRRDDRFRINTNTKEYFVRIDRDTEDFRKINVLIHHENWGPLVKTKGDATNIEEIIKQREEGWVE